MGRRSQCWQVFLKGSLKLSTLAMGLYLSSCSGLFYQPLSRLAVDPADYDIRYEKVQIETSDGLSLQGWFFPAELKAGQTLKGTVVQFHGNAENRSTHFVSLGWLTERGYNVLVFDYRGYADSQGRPTQEGLYHDGMAVIRYVKKKVKPLSHPDLILYGQSLGGAVLARCYEDVRERSRILSLVLDSSFYSYQAIARDVLSRTWLTWLLQPLGSFLVSDAYSPEGSIAKISPTPLLVIHGTNDQVIPLRFGEKIFELAKAPKRLWIIPEGGHIDAMYRHHSKYRDLFENYLDELISNFERIK